jgi:hypothetical protein
MSYITLRGSWCNIIVPNVHAPTDNESDESKDSFYVELERVLDQFLMYHTKIWLENFNAKVGKEDIFKPTIGNVSLYEISNDNGFRVENFVRSKNIIANRRVFPHRNIHKYTWTSGGKTHNQTITPWQIKGDTQILTMPDLLEELTMILVISGGCGSCGLI